MEKYREKEVVKFNRFYIFREFFILSFCVRALEQLYTIYHSLEFSTDVLMARSVLNWNEHKNEKMKTSSIYKGGKA